MRFSSFIGIDVSKATLDVHLAFKDDIKNGFHKTFNNTIKGFASMRSFIEKKGADVSHSLFCLENTGDYSLLLSYYLSKNKLHYHLANPLTVKL
ncbi:MAG: transposase [Flavobacteriales bacterium]|nr:transposase [Flavobacteriales bacterium]